MYANEKKLLIIDGSSYLYRAFHTYPEFMTNGKIKTNAIFGTTNMIQWTIRNYSSDKVVVVFDDKGTNFRHEMYPEYKANRSKAPEALKQQIDPLHNVIKSMGIPLLCVPDVEADDVIGTLAKQASRDGQKVLISTGDKDMAQLVDDNIMLINTMTNEWMDSKGVNDKFGIPPELIIDYLAIVGDNVDNIPGVAGVGDKSALVLLNTLGDLDAIYANVDFIPKMTLRGARGISAKMADGKSRAYLSRELATIRLDVPLDIKYTDLVISRPNLEVLDPLLKELGITALKDKVSYIHLLKE